MQRWIGKLEGWSLAHYVCDGALTTAATIILWWATNMPIGLTIIVGVCLLLFVPAVWVVWKREKRTRTESIADICDELATEGSRIGDQEQCRDWVRNVGVVLAANHAAELSAINGITQTIFSQEKLSKEAVNSVSRRASFFLRSAAVRMRNVDAIIQKEGPKNNFSGVAKIYRTVLADSAKVKDFTDAKLWGRRAITVLQRTGQTLQSLGLTDIVRRFEDVGANIPDLMREATEFWEVSTAFAREDDAETPSSGDQLSITNAVGSN